MKYWEMNKIRKILLWLTVKRAIRNAKRLAKRTGRPHYVVKYNGKISIIDKAWFKYQRQHGYIPKHITASNLKQIAIYYTR